MKLLNQLRLGLGGGAEMRPSSLHERIALVRKPARRFEPPREHTEPGLLVNGFLHTAPGRGIVGARDLSELKELLDNYAQEENTHKIEKRELARQLSERGIAHGAREMQPYEAGYEIAVLDSGSARPRVTFFVMPPAYPIRPKSSQAADPSDRTTSCEQSDLFSTAAPEKATRRSA